MPNRIGGNTNVPSTQPRTDAGGASYTVKSGDTLGKIAREAGVSLQSLINANKDRFPTLESNPGNIKVGWSLSIPAGGSAPAPNTPPQTGWAPRSNNEVLLVGMNKDSAFEVQNMRSNGVKVTYVTDSKVGNDQVKVGNTTHDLSTNEGAMQFALTLGLPAEQTAKVADAINAAGHDAKDEVAQLAQVWATAEKGGQIPSRLVLSGHNVGSGVWGDDNGKFSFDVLGKLAEAMPKAARSVEDLHLAACYSGSEALMDKYRGMFPNAQTIWAYSGSAPGSYSGATAHQKRWETATRGDVETLRREIAEHTRKGENVAVWSKQGGYMDGRPPAPLDELRTDVTQREETFQGFLSGSQAVENTQTGPLREYYNHLQRLVGHPQLPAQERTELEGRRDQTIRLLFFTSNVAPKFQQAYGNNIQQGFQALGLQAPDFSTMTRQQAMDQVKAFEEKLAGTNPKPAAAQQLLPLLTEGLRDLKSSRIPETWI